MAAPGFMSALAGATPPAGTALPPEEEAKYQAWKASLPPRLQYEGDYDLRGFWRENPTFSVDQPGQHMTDKFKLPNHETFSNESMYYNDQTKHLGGAWLDGPQGSSIYVPNDPAHKRQIVEDANGDRVDGSPNLAQTPGFIAALAAAGRLRP